MTSPSGPRPPCYEVAISEEKDYKYGSQPIAITQDVNLGQSSTTSILPTPSTSMNSFLKVANTFIVLNFASRVFFFIHTFYATEYLIMQYLLPYCLSLLICIAASVLTNWAGMDKSSRSKKGWISAMVLWSADIVINICMYFVFLTMASISHAFAGMAILTVVTVKFYRITQKL